MQSKSIDAALRKLRPYGGVRPHIKSIKDLTHKAQILSYYRDIEKSWISAAHNIILVGQLLLEARTKFKNSHIDFFFLLERLPFESRTASRLMRIGDDTRLRIEAKRNTLPPCWSTLYEISLLRDDELKKAKSAKLINPGVTRKQIVQFRQSLRQIKSGKEKVDQYLVAEFYVPAGFRNAKALLDLEFILDLAANNLFNFGRDSERIGVKWHPFLESRLQSEDTGASFIHHYRRMKDVVYWGKHATQEIARHRSGTKEFLNTIYCLLDVPQKISNNDYCLVEELINRCFKESNVEFSISNALANPPNLQHPAECAPFNESIRQEIAQAFAKIAAIADHETNFASTNPTDIFPSPVSEQSLENDTFCLDNSDATTNDGTRKDGSDH